jgi:hypothetical protein
MPKSDLVCDDCHRPIPVDSFGEYRTPTAFRTDFVPKDDSDELGRMAHRTVATVLEEGEPIPHKNMVVRRGAGATIMQLNDGVPDPEGVGQRFRVDEVVDLRVPLPPSTSTQLDQFQAIESSLRENSRSGRWEVNGATGIQFGLISRKKTDALYLELSKFDSRLTLNCVARKGDFFNIATRAAAISATQILVQKSALVLDVSAEEFEMIEPRLRGGMPMLQIADALINGSGLCRRLGYPLVHGGKPYIAQLIEEILGDKQAWPLQDFLGENGEGAHAEQCKTSCYRCIQRFGNRRYHGLLDWRLGLSYLRAMVDDGYSCGLDTRDRSLPEISGWHEYANGLAESVAAMRSGRLSYAPLKHSGLPCIIEHTAEGNELSRTVVVHPLWRKDGQVMSKVLGRDWSERLAFVDTFNLERRPLRILADMRSKLVSDTAV